MNSKMTPPISLSKVKDEEVGEEEAARTVYGVIVRQGGGVV